MDGPLCYRKLSVEETDFLGTLTFDTLPFGHIDVWLIDYKHIDIRYTWLLTGEPIEEKIICSQIWPLLFVAIELGLVLQFGNYYTDQG